MKVFSGQLCGLFASAAKLMGEMMGKYVQISFGIEGQTINRIGESCSYHN
jgi:hypothetical protein